MTGIALKTFTGLRFESKITVRMFVSNAACVLFFAACMSGIHRTSSGISLDRNTNSGDEEAWESAKFNMRSAVRLPPFCACVVTIIASVFDDAKVRGVNAMRGEIFGGIGTEALSTSLCMPDSALVVRSTSVRYRLKTITSPWHVAVQTSASSIAQKHKSAASGNRAHGH